MVMSSIAPFLSPRPSPKVHDCRQPTCPSSHAVSSVISPTQTRVQTCNVLNSPTNRRTARTCSALPFSFPFFGFPPFGSPSDSGQPGKGGSNSNNSSDNNPEGEWIRASGSPSSKSCNSDATEGCGGGGSAAGAGSSSPDVGGAPQTPSSPQQSVRRRLNLLPFQLAQACTAAAAITTTVATCDTAASVLKDISSSSAPHDSYADPSEELQQQQQGGGASGTAAGHRGSPLPYPWALSDDEGDCGGGDTAVTWGGEGSGRGPATSALRSDLDMKELPQLLLELSGPEDHPFHLHRQQLHRAPCLDPGSDSAMEPGAGHRRSPGAGAQQQQVYRRWQQQRQQQQRALLDQLHGGLAGGKLNPVEMLRVPGLVPFLSESMGSWGEVAVGQQQRLYGYKPAINNTDRWPVSERGVSAATVLALECLCTLLTEEALPAQIQCPALESQLVAAVDAAVRVLGVARLPSAVTAQNAASPPASASVTSYVASVQGPDSWSEVTAEACGWSEDVSAAFFAASVLVRASRVPVLTAAAVAAGSLGLLVRLMGCRPNMLAQMAVFATYKLVRQMPLPVQPTGASFAVGPGTAQPASLQGDGELTRCSGGVAVNEGQEGQHQQERGLAARERDWRDAALLAVAQSGGMRALCSCLEALEDQPSRDMASSLMLDMALVPQVPAVVAGLNHVQPLVGVMRSRRCDHIARMYALLALARLCNHSAECQMDAVREGAVEPLLALVQHGCEEEQTHACRLLAILAQAVPTHGRIKASGVVQAVLPLLRGARGSAAVVAEHASSVLAVLAQNPDMHFHIVGCGAVPAMVPLLGSGTEKARAYVLGSLMLLCEQEERHAAVVVRAGALPTLVAMVTTIAAPRSPSTAATAAPISSAMSATTQRAVASTQEFAAAVLCSLSKYVGVQTEMLACGALPALVRCLGQGPPEASINAAEALVHLAAGNSGAKRAVGSDPAATASMLRLLSHSQPSARYWSLQLLRAISTDDEALRLLTGLPHEDAVEAAEEEADATEGTRKRSARTEPSVATSAVRRHAKELAASFGLQLPALAATLASEAMALRGHGSASQARGLVDALVRLLRWPEGESASWQQGRCRVLAGWLLARMCGLRGAAPLLLASGAVRELMMVLAEEQQRQAELAASAASSDGFNAQVGESLGGHAVPPPPPRQLPLLPGEGEMECEESGFEADEDEEGGAEPGEPGGHRGAWAEGLTPQSAASSISGSGGGGFAYPRRGRFDINAAAAAAAALMSVARTGREGRLAVLSELTLLHWMGISVRLEGLDGV